MQKLKISDKISDIIDIIDINDINTIRWCSKYHKLLIVLLYATTISKIPILAIFGTSFRCMNERKDKAKEIGGFEKQSESAPKVASNKKSAFLVRSG